MSRPLQAAEPDRIVYVETEIDWASAGYTIKVLAEDPVTGSTSLHTCTSVSGATTQAKFTTTTTSFPNSGTYQGQTLAFNGVNDGPKSKPYEIPVGGNLP